MGKNKGDFWKGFAVAVIVLAAVVYFTGNPLSYNDVGQNGAPDTGNGYPLQLPIKITVRDKIAGTPVPGGTVYMIDAQGRIVETLTVGADGTATTALAYKSGEQYKLFYVGTGYGGAPVEFTVPLAASEAQSYYYAAVDVYHFPSDANLTLSIMDKLGAQVATEIGATGASFVDGKAELSLHIVLAEGYGLVSFDDPVEKEADDVLVVFILNDTLPTISANGLSLQRVEYGSNVYYFAKLGDIVASIDDPAIKDVGFTVFYSGTSAISLTVKVLTNTDPNVFASSLTVDSDGFEDATAALAITS